MSALVLAYIWAILNLKPNTHNWTYFFNAAEWIIMVLNQCYLGSMYFDWDGVLIDL